MIKKKREKSETSFLSRNINSQLIDQELIRLNSPLINDLNSSSVEDQITVKLEMTIKQIKSISEVDEDEERCICNRSDSISNDQIISIDTEIVPDMNIKVYTLYNNRNLNNNIENLTENVISLREIVSKLKEKGYPLTGSNIYYYNNIYNEKVYVGNDPLPNNLLIPYIKLNINIIHLWFICYIEDKFVVNIKKETFFQKEYEENNKYDKSKESKRTKERKIGFIIDKVNTWRKLFNGFTNEYDIFERYSLEEAALMINISKKSLDDYLLQLRQGRKYGFDFNKDKNLKVGILRTYIKKQLENEKIKNEQEKREDEK